MATESIGKALAKVTNTVTEKVVLTNRIMIDGRAIKTQQFEIDSNDPYNYTQSNPFEYNITSEDKKFYTENIAEFRLLEDAFEDKAFAKIAEMITEQGA